MLSPNDFVNRVMQDYAGYVGFITYLDCDGDGEIIVDVDQHLPQAEFVEWIAEVARRLPWRLSYVVFDSYRVRVMFGSSAPIKKSDFRPGVGPFL